MKMEMINSLRFIKKGKKILKDLQSRLGKNGKIYVSQHPAIGDAYIVGSYLKNLYTESDILTYIGLPSKEVYQMYKFKNMYELSQCETNCLIRYLQFMEVEESKVQILHYCALVEHTGIAFQFNGVNGLGFTDLLERYVFPGLTVNDRRYPEFLNSVDNKWGIDKKNSVIIFPYANTLLTPSMSFWKSIILKYKAQGKKVFTYVYGEEEILVGTSELRSSIQELPAIVEYAGEIFGVRNGLMDVIGNTQCKKIIIYPKCGAESWIKGKIRDFWSLKKMGYCGPCEEIEWWDDEIYT